MRRFLDSFSLGVCLVASALPHSEAFAQTLRLQGAVEWTVGGADDPREALALSQVSGLALTSDGGAVAVDLIGGFGVWISSNGQSVRTFGGRGRGPGQLSMPCCLGFASDQSLWVKEIGNRRYSVFRTDDSDVRFVASVIMPSQPDTRFTPVRVLQSGVVHLSPLPSRTGPRDMLRSVLTMDAKELRRATVAGANSDDLQLLVVEGKVPGGVVRNSMSPPFGPRELYAVGPDGSIARTLGSSYDVTIHDASGALRTTIRRTPQSIQITAAERDSAKRLISDWAQRFNASAESVAWTAPRNKPPIREIGYSSDGELWIIRNVPFGKPQQADIFDAKGTQIGTAEWPADVSLDHFSVRRDRAIGIKLDEDDVPMIVRLRFSLARENL